MLSLPQDAGSSRTHHEEVDHVHGPLAHERWNEIPSPCASLDNDIVPLRHAIRKYGKIIVGVWIVRDHREDAQEKRHANPKKSSGVINMAERRGTGEWAWVLESG